MHSADNILAISCLSFPYATILLYFGANTIWYLHVHLVCDRLLLSNWITSTFYYCVGFGTTFSIEPRGFIFQLDNNTNYSSVICHTCIAGGFMVYNHKNTPPPSCLGFGVHVKVHGLPAILKQLKGVGFAGNNVIDHNRIVLEPISCTQI